MVRRYRLGDAITPWSPINSSKIDQQKHRFTVLIYSPKDVQQSTGGREIRWSLTYADSNRPQTHTYLTQASIIVQFDTLGGPGVINKQWMDATSTREERHKRYVAAMKDAARTRNRLK